ncbi:MAG: hypothetical protein JJ920_19000 [Roseitalea sp.]|jgi:hypothetical protein|nr:hypothetical protein [Roseitalea sp.]MBO6722202.1 hypothetical protein [Roseitalea sp.]MBO6745007.1 hypothetical protein [Roseitalea sp.]
METFLFAFVTFLIAMAGMAAGVMAGRAPVKGSCGGAACLKGIDCGVCKARAVAEEYR